MAPTPGSPARSCPRSPAGCSTMSAWPGRSSPICTEGAVGEIERPPSSQDLTNWPAVIDLQALAAGDIEPARVEAQHVQQRGVHIRDIVRVLDRMEAQFIGRAVDGAPLDPGACQPDGEGVRVMIAARRRGGDPVANLESGGST